VSAPFINPALLGVMRIPDPAPAASAAKSSPAPTNLLSAVPQILKDIPNWVAWKMAPGADGKLTKVPFIVGSNFQRKAKSSDSATWTDFNTAVTSTERNHVQGIGIVLGGRTKELGLAGVDIDGCRNPETGEITEWAEKIIQRLDSYTEITPSETGVRVWIIGKVPDDEKVFKLDPAIGHGDKVQIEIYSDGRYFTITGNSVYEDPGDVETRDLASAYELFRGLKQKHPATAKTTATPAVAPTADTAPAAAAQHESVQVQKTGTAITDKLELLMHGNPTGDKPFILSDDAGNLVEYPDRSSADLALCTLLAMKYGDNSDAIWKDYTESAIARDKWLDREKDFRRLTIAKAIKSAQAPAVATAAAPLTAQLVSPVSPLAFLSNSDLADALGFHGGMEQFDRQFAIRELTRMNHPLIAAGIQQVSGPPDYRYLLEADLKDSTEPWILQHVKKAYELGDAPENWVLFQMLFEGGFHLLSGHKGSMKSILSLLLAFSLCTAADFMGRRNIGHPITVVYIDRENPKSVVKTRCAALGLLDLENFRIWGDWDPDDRDPAPTTFDDPRLIECARRMGNRVFFIFDSLSSFSEGAEENSNTEMAPIAEKALRLARMCAGIIVLHHLPRNGKEARGATVTATKADMAFIVKKTGTVAEISEERFRPCAGYTMSFDMNFGTMQPDGKIGAWFYKCLDNGLPGEWGVKPAASGFDAGDPKAAGMMVEAATIKVAVEQIKKAYEAGGQINSARQLATICGVTSVRLWSKLFVGGKDQPWDTFPNPTTGNGSGVYFVPKGKEAEWRAREVQREADKVARKAAAKAAAKAEEKAAKEAEKAARAAEKQAAKQASELVPEAKK
jgi:hypothetical protein